MHTMQYSMHSSPKWKWTKNETKFEAYYWKKLPAEWAENNKVQKDQRDFVVT